MTSVKERISFTGILRGYGQEASCEGYVTQVTLPRSGIPSAHTEFLITNVSKQLPEGEYQLLAQGETLTVQHRSGKWSSTS